MQLKQISLILFAVSFVCVVLLLTGKTFGFRPIIQPLFYITGGTALVLNLIVARQESFRGDFNVVFWIGNLVVFIGLLLKTYYMPYSTEMLIGGIALCGLSYFINPFGNNRRQEDEDELLDQ